MEEWRNGGRSPGAPPRSFLCLPIPGAPRGLQEEKLKKLDGVAYVRFASVYWRFDDAAEFLKAVQRFEERDDTTTIQLPGF